MADQHNRMIELAADISTHVQKIVELTGASHEKSQSESGCWNLVQLRQSRDAVQDSLDELQILAQEPLDALLSLIKPSPLSISLQAIYRLNIAQVIGPDEVIPYIDLGTRCNQDPLILRRLLRQAAAYGIFHEPECDKVAHNTLSRLLVQIPLLHLWNGYIVEEMWPASVHMLDAMQKWPASEEPSQTGFALASGSEKGFFEVLEQDQARTDRFAAAMAIIQGQPGLSSSFLIDNFDMRGESSGVIVDVGGSHGSVAKELLNKFSNFCAIVQDKAEVVRTAQVPPELKDRLDFQGHDFFTPQPVSGADIYLLRMILHDWPDKYAIQILRNLIPALKQGARVILNESCIPEPGMLSSRQEKQLRGFDMAMCYMFNSKERTAADWMMLFEKADTRFKCVTIKHIPGSMLSIIESQWSP